jgi:hypothetical protein
MRVVLRSLHGCWFGLIAMRLLRHGCQEIEPGLATPEGAGSRGSTGWRCGRAVCVLLALASACTWLALVSVAGASAQSLTWTGGALAGSPNWSLGANWEKEVAPTSSTSIEELDFPYLENRCAAAEPADTCYESENDLNGLTVESMHIDDGEDYGIFGKGITLGAGGLSASPPKLELVEMGGLGLSASPAATTNELTLAIVGMPIALDSSQTWSIGGAGRYSIGEHELYLGGDVTGSSSDELKVKMSEGGALDLGGEDEVGPVAIEGAEPREPGGVNGFVGLFGGALDSSDHEPVSLSHVFFYGAGTVGPLTSNDAELDIASGESSEEGTLNAASATLGSDSSLKLEITGAGATAGVDYSHLTSPGSVDLGSADLGMRVAPPGEGKPCPLPEPGQKYTLVSTTGGLSGTFANAPENGDEVPIKFAKECEQVTQKLLIEYSESGPTQTVTGTVIAPPSSTTLSALPSSPVTNQSVTLTATVVASSGSPWGTVAFQGDRTAIPGCSSEPVMQDGVSYTATCQTSFAASGSPPELSAAFTPGPGVNLQGSASAPDVLTVGQGSTTTTLQVSNATPAIGASVTYTATVTPGSAGAVRPSGSVAFLDGGSPIGSCPAQPLAAGGQGSCSLSYTSAGAHAITARYAGDANFTGSSSSPAQSVTVQAESPGSTTGGSTAIAGTTQATTSEVLLAGTSLSVQSDGVASVKLECSGGTEDCSGKLTLSAKQTTGARRADKGSRAVTIGSAQFTIAPQQTTTVKLDLNAAGRALLSAEHGQLSASLTIVEAGPGAEQPQVRSLRLVLGHSSGKARRRKKR